jgi:RluA family pseudouridine synthase
MDSFDLFSFEVLKEQKLSEAISNALNISKRAAKRIVDEGLCCLNGRKELLYSRVVKRGDLIEGTIPNLLFKRPSIEVIYEDEFLIAVNKPPFVNSNLDFPDVESLVSRNRGKVFAVHRLDRQTSGVLLLSKSREFLERMKVLFREKRIKKIYRAIVYGKIGKPVVIRRRLEGKEAITKVKPLESFGFATYVLVEIETGRKHQIRKHLAYHGNYVIGEFVYFKGLITPEVLRFSPRILLHSNLMEFKHPVSGKRVRIEAKIPSDFKEFRNLLKSPLQEYT